MYHQIADNLVELNEFFEVETPWQKTVNGNDATKWKSELIGKVRSTLFGNDIL